MRIVLFPRIHDRLREIDWKIESILEYSRIIYEKERQMSLELDALVAEVAEAEDAETKAIAFIEGILAQLVAAGTDPVKLTELKDGLKATTDALVAEFAKVPAPPEA